jgi:hypothetical protein
LQHSASNEEYENVIVAAVVLLLPKSMALLLFLANAPSYSFILSCQLLLLALIF